MLSHMLPNWWLPELAVGMIFPESVSDWTWEIVPELNPEQGLLESGFESSAQILRKWHLLCAEFCTAQFVCAALTGD